MVELYNPLLMKNHLFISYWTLIFDLFPYHDGQSTLIFFLYFLMIYLQISNTLSHILIFCILYFLPDYSFFDSSSILPPGFSTRKIIIYFLFYKSFYNPLIGLDILIL